MPDESNTTPEQEPTNEEEITEEEPEEEESEHYEGMVDDAILGVMDEDDEDD